MDESPTKKVKMIMEKSNSESKLYGFIYILIMQNNT